MMKYVDIYHSNTIFRKFSTTQKLKSPYSVWALRLRNYNSYMRNPIPNKKNCVYLQ